MAAVRLLLAATLAVSASQAVAVSGAYKEVFLDDPSVCNKTIRMHKSEPAVLVRLSPGQLARPLTCAVQFDIGDPVIGERHELVGMTAVVEELNVGRFDDVNNCSSYLQVTTEDYSNRYQKRLCGEWRSSIHHLEVQKSLFGTCDRALNGKRGHQCAVRHLNLLLHVPGDAVTLPPAITVVVTGYFMERLLAGCGMGRFQCATTEGPDRTGRCISDLLVCDGHPNCGFINNEDEFSSSCKRYSDRLTEADHFFATWAGFAVIVLLLVVAVSYFIRSVRWSGRGPPEPPGRPRVVLEPAPIRPIAPEPPAYEALYPSGPPASFLEKKRERAGDEPPPPPPTAAPSDAPPPPPPPPTGTPRQTSRSAVTHIFVEPGASAEAPPPYSEQPAQRHSVLLASTPRVPD